MAEAQSFELLKKKRKSFRTAVTKVVNELEAELSNSDLNVDMLSELVETLSIKFEPLTLVDQQLEPLFKPEQFDGEFEITKEYREKVLLWQFRAKKKINEYLKPRVTSPSFQTTLSQSQDEHFRNSDNIRIKVPKYYITRFYGDDASKWLTFWNSFETAVHNNESLNKVDKFNYLKAHLGGSALNTVEGFPISAKAYDEAVELLKNRFANPEILIQAHMNKILLLQPLKNSNDLRSFRKFVDNCNVQLRSLNSLGVSSANYGKILCPILLKLIPSDLLLDYNKLQQNGSGSDIQQLLSFLTQSLTAREQTYTMDKSSFELYDCRQETKSNFSREHRSHKQQNQKSFHTACELLTAPVKENKDKTKLICIFCDSMTHNSNECENVINMSLEERKNILLRKGACFNCLKVAKHLSRNCPMNKTKCEICSGLHHKFFCFKQQKREIESMSTDLANQNTGEVFLQTLTVYIKNGNSKQLIRAILDTGSQKCYISEYAAKFIGLKSIGKETITHGLFGGHKITEVHDKYLKLATLNVFISDSSANNKLCLFEKHSDEIHILLGSDIVGKLFTGEVKQLSEGLTAVNTHLGWTVMGKLSNESKFKSENSLLVHSLLTNREKISDLWELDSLCIKDPSEKRSKLELQDLALKHCENTILRDDEGGYIVSIPWTEGSGKFEDHYSLAKGRLEKTVKTLKFTGRLFDYDQQAPEHLEKAAEKLKDSMFVDNCVASVDSSELKSFQRDSTELLTLGKFDLSGWRHSDIEPNFDFRDNRQESGPQEIQIMWSMKEDTFSISYREIDIERKFEAWKKQLMEIQNIKIPRRLSNLDFKDANLSLRFFRDSTKSSYARHDFHLPFILSSNHPVIKARINYKHAQLDHDGDQMLMYRLKST
ncbi:integrase catalytic domain-containing protein [Trichonephila clavata]|uniref:Integrase catalytic domain-containing protein n=1 Tax=Trichonephila clavata TaxID=2740835 RepID=A0A8X6J413_TRICU|nr:integrase catalytic domain-containing protein [Trichonephila clavata]